MAFLQSDLFSASGSATTAAQAFGSNTVAGSLLVVDVAWAGTNTLPTITDTQGNVYQQSGTTLSIGGEQSATFYAEDIAGGACTVTATWAAAKTFRSLAIHEYDDMATSGALDQTVGQTSSGTGTTATSGALTPSVDGCVLHGWMHNLTSGNIAPGTDFTQREEDTGNWRMSEDFTQATAASHAATWTVDNNADYAARLSIFKPAAGGVVEADGSSAGVATASAVGAAIFTAVASSAGVASADAEGENGASTVVEADATSAGAATATALSQTIAQAVFTSAGVATVTAEGEDAAAPPADPDIACFFPTFRPRRR